MDCTDSCMCDCEITGYRGDIWVLVGLFMEWWMRRAMLGAACSASVSNLCSDLTDDARRMGHAASLKTIANTSSRSLRSPGSPLPALAAGGAREISAFRYGRLAFAVL